MVYGGCYISPFTVRSNLQRIFWRPLPLQLQLLLLRSHARARARRPWVATPRPARRALVRTGFKVMIGHDDRLAAIDVLPVRDTCRQKHTHFRTAPHASARMRTGWACRTVAGQLEAAAARSHGVSSATCRRRSSRTAGGVQSGTACGSGRRPVASAAASAATRHGAALFAVRRLGSAAREGGAANAANILCPPEPGSASARGSSALRKPQAACAPTSSQESSGQPLRTHARERLLLLVVQRGAHDQATMCTLA